MPVRALALGYPTRISATGEGLGLIGGHLTELGLAGNVALRLQREIEWDGPGMKAVGVPEADALVRKQNRAKWL